jgi:hypothetical protein
LPVEDYTPAYIVLEDWWEEFHLSDGFKVPGTEMAEEYDLTHFQEANSQRNPDLRRRRTA